MGMLNVIGGNLKLCCVSPLTAYFRDGYCRTGADDLGVHCICAIMTEQFLQFSLSQGNDLITPRREYQFHGLKVGDKWCLCALRWKEAFEAGCAPKVVLEATAESALEFVDLDDLKAHAFLS